MIINKCEKMMLTMNIYMVLVLLLSPPNAIETFSQALQLFCDLPIIMRHVSAIHANVGWRRIGYYMI